MSKRVVRSKWVGVFAAMFLLAGTSLAFAEETRDTYKAQVEPICKRNAEADSRILKGVKANVKDDKLKLAATQFAKAATALKKALNQLKAVPKPPADAARLTKWLGYVKTEVELFEQVSKKLKAGQKSSAQRLSIRLTSTVNRANNEVLAFEFKYCRVNPSQFT
jgi:hypothetical protein